MPVEDVKTPVVAEPEKDEPQTELVETPDGLEADLPEEGALSWREKKQKRREEYTALEEERNRLREENDRLRAQPAPYQPPPTPQPRPEDEEYGQIDTRLSQIQKDKQMLWKVGQVTTDKAELEDLAKRADELERETRLLSARQAMLVYGVHRPAQQQTPVQTQLQVLQGEFQDVYGDERARIKAQALFQDAQADGKKPSADLLRDSLSKARAWVRAGYKSPPPVSPSLKLRTSGERSGGPSTGSENRVRVTSEVEKWATAIYPKLPKSEAVRKYLDGQGAEVKKIQQKKTG